MVMGNDKSRSNARVRGVSRGFVNVVAMNAVSPIKHCCWFGNIHYVLHQLTLVRGSEISCQAAAVTKLVNLSLKGMVILISSKISS